MTALDKIRIKSESNADPIAVLATVLASEPSSELYHPHEHAYAAKLLYRIAVAAKRRAEAACNGDGRRHHHWDDIDEAHKDAMDAKGHAQASEIAALYGATVEPFQGDPRGFIVRLKLASGRSNSWDRKTWGIA
jgi:hypothetical protein